MKLLFYILIGTFVCLVGCSSTQSVSQTTTRESDIELDSSSPKRKAIISRAKRYVGTPYNSKKHSKIPFDCSGYVRHVYGQFNIDLPRSSREMMYKGKKVKKPNVGDLVFFANGKRINHVAIVYKVDKKGIHIIHSTSSKGVVIDNLNESTYWKSRLVAFKNVLS